MIEKININDITPAYINNKIYHPVNIDSPDIIELSKDIAEKGQLEPIVISNNDVIISGHRRYAAMQRLGFATVDVRRINICSWDDNFEKLLVAFNNQRVKSIDEILRESVVSKSKDEVYRELQDYRITQAQTELDKNIELVPYSERNRKITSRTQPFLNKVINILDHDLNKFLPVSVRQIHYNLLNHENVFTDTSNPDSIYKNDVKSYKKLSRLLTNARINGDIPFSLIHDETRPTTLNSFYNNSQQFINREINNFLQGYWRNLNQSQPNHIEVIAEKLTIQSIIKPVCEKYCIPCIIARGYSSISTYHETVQRFRKSGKNNLILLMLTDFDPEGEDMVQNAFKTLDEFEIQPTIHKVGINEKQFMELDPRFLNPAKLTSSRSKGFIKKYGKFGAELEALSPDKIQELLTNSIESALDIDLFNKEVEKEKEEAQELHTKRQKILSVMETI